MAFLKIYTNRCSDYVTDEKNSIVVTIAATRAFLRTSVSFGLTPNRSSAITPAVANRPKNCNVDKSVRHPEICIRTGRTDHHHEPWQGISRNHERST